MKVTKKEQGETMRRTFEDGRREGERRLLKRLVEELLKVNLDDKFIPFP
jgi:hypothetical protein